MSVVSFLLLLPAARGKVAFDWMKCKVTNHIFFHFFFFCGWRGGVAKNRSVCFCPGCVVCVIPADPQSAWPVNDLSLGFNFPSRFMQVTHIIFFFLLAVIGKVALCECVPCCCVVLLCVCVWAGHGFTDVWFFWGLFCQIFFKSGIHFRAARMSRRNWYSLTKII